MIQPVFLILCANNEDGDRGQLWLVNTSRLNGSSDDTYNNVKPGEWFDLVALPAMLSQPCFYGCLPLLDLLAVVW